MKWEPYAFGTSYRYVDDCGEIVGKVFHRGFGEYEGQDRGMHVGYYTSAKLAQAAVERGWRAR